MHMPVTTNARVLGVAPSFTVPNVEQAVDFYCNSLGFQSDSADEWFGLVSRDGVSVMLWHGAATPNGSCDAFFWVDAIDALHSDFQQKNVTVTRAPQTMEYGVREMSLTDASGYVIIFGQRIS
jgi:uncharacterized glyoxalase superfamily protein PhnB